MLDAAALVPPSAPPPAAVCVVERITDGDTLRCADGRRVRLLGIDAPERDQRPHGDAARRALARLVPEGTRVTLETGRTRRDAFNRVLAFVLLPDGTNVNERLLSEGFVVRYVGADVDRATDRRWAQAEAAARAAKAGLWASGGFACRPRDHRRGAC
jgi:endonuclease YncB( thermonuclease family)